jgi:hypothetical protein
MMVPGGESSPSTSDRASRKTLLVNSPTRGPSTPTSTRIWSAGPTFLPPLLVLVVHVPRVWGWGRGVQRDSRAPSLVIPKECAIFNRQYQEDSGFYTEYLNERVFTVSPPSRPTRSSGARCGSTSTSGFASPIDGREHVPKKSEAKKKSQSDTIVY